MKIKYSDIRFNLEYGKMVKTHEGLKKNARKWTTCMLAEKMLPSSIYPYLDVTLKFIVKLV